MAQPQLDQLLRAAANGDRSAFRAIYDTTSTKLFGVAVRILKRKDLAEDVMQDAYLKIWDAAPRYRPELGSPISWMVAITRNRAIDVLRKRTEVAVEDEKDGGERADDAPDPFEMTAQSRELKALLRCMEKLGDNQRQSLLMAYYYGYTHEEISQRMARPVGTVKSWIRRGLIQLKGCLGDD
ncbi:MAG: RNA polymerase sigma factor [Methyloligellaceae bacterium]